MYKLLIYNSDGKYSHTDGLYDEEQKEHFIKYIVDRLLLKPGIMYQFAKY